MAIAIGLLAMNGCGDSHETPAPLPPAPDGTEFSETFIQMYLVPTGIRLVENSPSTADFRCILIQFDGTDFYKPGSEEFELLSRRYGDTDYNTCQVPYSNLALAEPVTAVSVRWTAKGDAAAFTRTPDAQTRICAPSPYEFIQSGYQYPSVSYPAGFEWLQNGNSAYIAIVKPLSELGATDLALADLNSHYLVLPANPEIAAIEVTLTVGTQTFTSTLDIAPKP